MYIYIYIYIYKVVVLPATSLPVNLENFLPNLQIGFKLMMSPSCKLIFIGVFYQVGFIVILRVGR